jgi:Spy/CpxP family protein refolding chaperone
MSLNEEIFAACKELIDDAKMGCADLVFKEICLEILNRARNVLKPEQFEQLTEYAAQRMKEKSLTEATLPL